MFLTNADLTNKIVEVIKGSKSPKLAVSFWGENAIERLGLRKNSDIKILCALESGACNPKEIRRLWEKNFTLRENVRTVSKLHAKVYIGDKSMIVSSANASANGLGDEGDDTKGTIEAGFFVDNIENLTQANEWFDGLFNHNKYSSAITNEKLEVAQENWKYRQSMRDNPDQIRKSRKSLAELLQERPNILRGKGVYVFVYENDGLDADAKRAEKALQDKFGKDLEIYQEDRQYPYDMKWAFDFQLLEKSLKISDYWMVEFFGRAKKLNADWYIWPHYIRKDVAGVKITNHELKRIGQWALKEWHSEISRTRAIIKSLDDRYESFLHDIKSQSAIRLPFRR